jgi:serine/threonine-protein kinase
MGQPLPPATALLFALQIARGMQHAVKQIEGFVHRDLKPENVLVGADKLPGTAINRLRVTDFGLAAVLQSTSASPSTIHPPASSNQHPASRTQLTHGIVGTPLYMAPEQWEGGDLGVHTNVYALGGATHS